MTLPMFPSTPSREDRIREALRKRGLTVLETDRRGVVQVLRDGVELGALSWAEWEKLLDGGGL